MAGLFNLKSIFTADTKDLKKGAAEAKQAVKDFDSATTSALDEVTGLFGVSMGEINKTLSTLKGGFLSLSGAINKTSESATLGSKALKVFKIALASTGVGALVVALGSLVAYFTKTQRGADLISRVMGQVGQVFKTVTDYAILLGEKIFKAFTNPVQAVKNFWNLLSNKEERQKLKDELSNIGKDFEDRQQRRLALTERQQKLERDQAQWTVESARLQTEIEQQREIAADKANRTNAERLAANLKAQELLDQLYAREEQFAQERLDILREENSLSESMNKDIQAEANLEAELIQLQGQKSSRKKELLSQQGELTNLVKKEREEEERIAALKTRKAAELTLQKIDSGALLDQKVASPTIVPTIDTSQAKEGAEELNGYVVEFGEIINDFSNTVSDAFASMIEGLVSGNLNMTDIFNTVLQFLADNLKAIGKALIAYGMAMEGFKKAFSNPWAAIAAGTALVAAGAVLSGLIKRASSGGSSASASFATATSVGSGGTLDLTSQTQFRQQPQELRVTGTIKASGRDLAVVIENENKRKNYTT